MAEHTQVDLVSSRVYPDLERSPGKRDNWVEQVGGLPDYIERIAKHLHYEEKMTISRSIAVAVNTVKRWAKGGTVTKSGTTKRITPKTQALAAKALAEWNAKKARAKLDLSVELTREEKVALIDLAVSFNTEVVRRAYRHRQEVKREAMYERHRRANKGKKPEEMEPYPKVPYRYVKEVWSDHLIVSGDDESLFKVPYVVGPTNNDVTFGKESEVTQEYVELSFPVTTEMIDLALTKDGRKSYKRQGKWKHGFIPVDRAAKVSKAKGSPVAMKRMRRLYGKSKSVEIKSTGRNNSERVTRAAQTRRTRVAEQRVGKQSVKESSAEHSRGGGKVRRSNKAWDEIPEAQKVTRNGKRYVMSVYQGQTQLVQWTGGQSQQAAPDDAKRTLRSIRPSDAARMSESDLRKMLKVSDQPASVKKVLNRELRKKITARGNKG